MKTFFNISFGDTFVGLNLCLMIERIKEVFIFLPWLLWYFGEENLFSNQTKTLLLLLPWNFLFLDHNGEITMIIFERVTEFRLRRCRFPLEGTELWVLPARGPKYTVSGSY